MVVACLALALSGLAVGILIGRNLAPSAPAAKPDEAVASIDLDPIVKELRQINESVQRLTRVGPAPVDSAAATGTSKPISETSQLVAATPEPQRSIDGRRDGAASLRSEPSRWKGAGYPSIDAMFERITELVKAAGNSASDARTVVYRELCRAHFLWTRDDVLDRYGVPDYTQPEANGINLIYIRTIEQNDKGAVVFKFQGALVAAVDVK
jgi:hypothetical protein